MLPSRSLPPLECCLGTSPIQAEKLRPERKVLGVRNARDQSGRQHWTDAGNVMKALARLVGSVPGQDQPIELQDLLFEAEQLCTERGNARAGNLRQPLVARVGNNMQQFRDSFTPNWRDDTELSEVPPDRINHCSLLADEQMACAMKHQAALLLRHGRRRRPSVRASGQQTWCGQGKTAKLNTYRTGCHPESC